MALVRRKRKYVSMTRMRVVLLIVTILLVPSLASPLQANKSPKLDSVGRFDEDSAIRTLYGHAEPYLVAANAAVPSDNSVDLGGSEFKAGDPLVVRPFWSTVYEDRGTKQAVLLTYAVPFKPDWKPITQSDEPFSCHACAPLLGVAIFQRLDGRWTPKASRVTILRVGAWGQPPSSIRLIQIGPHRKGIAITDTYSGGGSTTTSKVLIAFDESTISSALQILLGEDNAGACERHRPSRPTEGPECYRYRKNLTLRPGPNADYFDIYTYLHGTDYGEGSSQDTRAVLGKEIFRWINGRYVSVLREGSITSTEKSLTSNPLSTPNTP